MDIQGISEPTELERIRSANAEQVYFQDLKNEMIIRMNQQWKSCNEIQGTFQNKYYNFEYTIVNCYNQSGNRKFQFIHSGKTLNDYRCNDIKNWLKTNL